jgi:hypothetical protein
MLQEDLKAAFREIHLTRELSDVEAEKFRQARLLHEDKPKLVDQLLTTQTKVYKPNGELLLALVKDILDEDLCDEAFELLRQVKGDPSNRPEIVGKGARMQAVRKDGTVGLRIGVPSSVLKLYGGKTDFLGHYRYKNSAPGAPDCKLTGWTRSKPSIYQDVMPLIHEVNKIYKAFLPTAHKRQMEYVGTVPQEHKIRGTAFTTLYVLKNAPTAVHTDDMDIRTGFGVMTSLGGWKGGELYFPKFRVAVDYRPGDVILADVHELHGNFPLIEGIRVACVFFVREGIHECPVSLTL